MESFGRLFVKNNLIYLFALLPALVGCTTTQRDAYWVQAPPQPVPTTHLPESNRIRNWSGRSVRGGSCVHASTINAFRAMDAPEWEAVWRVNRSRGYEGGETANGILRKYCDQGLPYIATKSADMPLWELATKTRRVGIWWYYPSHCVTNFGIYNVPDQSGRMRRSVVMLDNNRTDSYIAVDEKVAKDAWQYYGGFGVVPWVTPATPYTFPGLLSRS